MLSVKHVTRKKKLYRHSTTFYRRVKNKLSKLNSVLESVSQQSDKIHQKLDKNLTNTAENSLFDNLSDNESYSCVHKIDENIEVLSNFCDDIEKNSEKLANDLSLQQCLREWALRNNICHVSIDDLLRILISKGFSLPKDSRTLLKTPTFVNIVPMGKGSYWYYGVVNNLKNIFQTINQLPQSISLIFNIDGLCAFKSSKKEMWPILFKVHEFRNIKPKIIAIYYGEGKPPLHPYLSCFVKELNNILLNGVIINERTMSVKIKFFVCDTPARSYIKGTVGFNSYHGCLKCTVVGEYDKNEHHMSFPRTNCPLRTNISFRNNSDTEHHKEVTPISTLPIDMVEDIIIADSLHLIDLGVMRKCLFGWINGSFGKHTKLSGAQINELSYLLENCNKFKPAEIHRAIRGLNYIKIWKASEYRTFLLYIGPIILKPFLKKDAYEHFLILFCAVRLVSSYNYFEFLHIAKTLFQDYIEYFIKLYGQDTISSNVHNLCHVVNDVKKFGPLPNISTYPFEDFLGQIKHLIRSGRLPLQQVAKRILEFSNIDYNVITAYTNKISLEKEIKDASHRVRHCDRVFNKINFGNFILCNEKKNKWFLTYTNEIVEMINATYQNGKTYIYGCPIKNKYDYFDLPIRSSYINVYESNGEKCRPKLYSADNDVKFKMFCYYFDTNLIFFPLLHLTEINSIQNQ